MSSADRGGELRRETRGSGEPVLLLAHGWGHDRTVWREVAARLAGRFTTVAFDARGFGDSEDALADPDGWTLDTAVDDLASVVASFAPAPVVAVGHSFQGSAVLALASRGVPGLAGVVAIAGAPRWTNAPEYGLAIDLAQADQFVALLAADYAATIAQVAAAYFPDTDAAAAARGLADTIAIAGRVRRPEVPVGILRQVYREDIRALLPRIRIPVLLIHGERDGVASLAAGRYLADRIPAARLEVVAGAGHCPHMAAPQRIAKLVVDLAAHLDPAARPGTRQRASSQR